MRVFKFGGASVKDAAGVANLAQIVASENKDGMFVVVSAMGKTTNALEQVLEKWQQGNPQLACNLLEEIKLAHHAIIKNAFPGLSLESVINDVNRFFSLGLEIIKTEPSDNPNFDYDRLVSLGELVSTRIVYQFLKNQSLPVIWEDAGSLIRTDNNYKTANVLWEESEQKMHAFLAANPNKIVVTQGFIGKTKEGQRTTLGREGSDFSGAILAYTSKAASLTIWKDVPGLLNADPRLFEDTIKLKEISYREALELSYYGASVIHPKTVKPLQNRKIPLFIKPFLAPEQSGSKVFEIEKYDADVPSYIVKPNQRLLSISPRDFSFMVEENLTDLFAAFSKFGITANLMQNSAISFSVVIEESYDIAPLISELSSRYQLLYNDGLSLITIRHYNEAIIEKLTQGKEILVEQKTRTTVRFVCN